MIIGLCAGLATTAARADSGDFVGRWQWNRAQPAPPPGEAAPASIRIDISRAEPSRLTWSLTVVDAPGDGPQVETFDALADGEFHPINSDTTASFHLNGDGVLQAVFKGLHGQSDILACALSANKKTMTKIVATSQVGPCESFRQPRRIHSKRPKDRATSPPIFQSPATGRRKR